MERNTQRAQFRWSAGYHCSDVGEWNVANVVHGTNPCCVVPMEMELKLGGQVVS